MIKKFLRISVMGALVLAATHPAVAQETTTTPATEMSDYTIPEGTEFKLQLHTTISSKTSKVGDRVMTTLYDPVYVYDETVLAKGARVDGHIGEVKSAGRRGKGGYLTVVFDSVELPNGEKAAILGSLTEIFSSEGGSDPKVGVEGDLKGSGPSTKTRLAIMAIPTGAVAAAGAGAGPAIAVGVASVVMAYVLPKGEQAALTSGSLIGMRLDRDVTVTIPVTSQ